MVNLMRNAAALMVLLKTLRCLTSLKYLHIRIVNTDPASNGYHAAEQRTCFGIADVRSDALSDVYIISFDLRRFVQ